jgi:general stress protein 26
VTASIPFDLVERELRRQHFAVLSTVDEASRPHSAGVSYGLSLPGQPLAVYVMTRMHLAKARNIARNPRVACVVPVTRRLLSFLPPATIQLQGAAEILDWDEEAGRAVFRDFWLGRRILKAYAAMRRRGKTRICFLKIVPDPLIHTYMVGRGLWEISKDIESGAGVSTIPVEYR